MRANFPLRETVMPSFKHKTTFVCWLIVIIIFVFFLFSIKNNCSGRSTHDFWREGNGDGDDDLQAERRAAVGLYYVCIFIICKMDTIFWDCLNSNLFGISICFQLFSTDVMDVVWSRFSLFVLYSHQK